MLRKIFQGYETLEKPIFSLVLANLSLNLINSAFIILLPYYFRKEGFQDWEFAKFIATRFFAVMLFAFPLGIFIKGRSLISFFRFATLMVPCTSLALIYSISSHNELFIRVFLMLWGVGFLCFQIGTLPFILRNAVPSSHSGAIALNFSIWGITQFTTGFIIFILRKINPVFFEEKTLLIIFSIAGFSGFYFVNRIKLNEKIPTVKNRYFLKAHDWFRIFKVLTPNIMIAIGAGLTIPFMPLFFADIFYIPVEIFSLFGSFTAILVSFCSVAVPYFKDKFGYKTAIISTQSLAIVALILLAGTELLKEWNFALYLAILCFILRQPLMNMAGPLTSELGMNYVGERNQEIVSALQSTIWSGSWFVSSMIFSHLRKSGLPYYKIFLITAAFYSVGVFLYFRLINEYQRAKILKGAKITVKETIPS